MSIKTLFDKFNKTYAYAKFHWDIGNILLGFINFALLVIAASPVIQQYWKVPLPRIVSILVPVSIFLCWLFGYIMDKYMDYQRNYYRHSYDRVPQLDEIKAQIEELKGMIIK